MMHVHLIKAATCPQLAFKSLTPLLAICPLKLLLNNRAGIYNVSIYSILRYIIYLMQSQTFS